MEDNLKKNQTNFQKLHISQYRKPDQHNNQKYIGTLKKINLI